MKSIIKIMLWIVEFILGAILVVYAIFSTMLIKISITDGTIRDGFGRILQPAPAWLLIDDHYSGLGWYLFDTALGFAILIIMYLIYQGIKKLGRTNPVQQTSASHVTLIKPAPIADTPQQNFDPFAQPQSEIEELMQELYFMRSENAMVDAPETDRIAEEQQNN